MQKLSSSHQFGPAWSDEAASCGAQNLLEVVTAFPVCVCLLRFTDWSDVQMNSAPMGHTHLHCALRDLATASVAAATAATAAAATAATSSAAAAAAATSTAAAVAAAAATGRAHASTAAAAAALNVEARDAFEPHLADRLLLDGRQSVAACTRSPSSRHLVAI